MGRCGMVAGERGTKVERVKRRGVLIYKFCFRGIFDSLQPQEEERGSGATAGEPPPPSRCRAAAAASSLSLIHI